MVAEQRHCVDWSVGHLATDGHYLYMSGQRPDQRPGANDAFHRPEAENALLVIDPRAPDPWREIGTLAFDTGITRLEYADQHVYAIADGLHVVDVTDPNQPRRVWQHDWSVPWFRGAMTDDPGQISRVGAVGGMQVDGSLALVQVVDRSIEIIDISAPGTPRWVGRVPLHSGDTARGVAILDNYAYVMDGGLRVIDLSNPAAPRDVQTVEAPSGSRVSQALAVDARNRLLYSVNSGLWVFDLANPSAPRLVWGAEKAGMWQAGPSAMFEIQFYRDVSFSDDLAYTVAGDGMFSPTKLLAFDRRDPARPRRIGKPLMERPGGAPVAIGDTIYFRAVQSPKEPNACPSTIVEMDVAVRSGILP